MKAHRFSAKNSSFGKEESYWLMNNDGLFDDITRVDLPIGEKDNNAPDMLMVGDDLFTLYINFDNSHDEYYGGVAVQKVNLKTRDQERIYCVMNFTIMIAVSIWRVEV